ncbi:MAG: BamA/TamA family outer membrane protein [Rubrivivax sp.]|nr:BamA/TamA family outer membrane protein [Rubrivivax sp.]
MATWSLSAWSGPATALALLALTLGAAAPPPVQAQAQSAPAAALPADPPPTPTRTLTPTLEVRGFVITGHTLLSETQLKAPLEAFVGLRTVSELQTAALAVQRVYAQAGFGGVAVVVPPQTPRHGMVTLQVLEGRLTAPRVQGARRQTREQILAALPPLQAGQTPRLRALDGALQLANENPSRRLELLLKPGASAGEIDAVVSVHETALQQLSMDLDNTGSAQTGRWRLGLLWRHGNFLGLDDSLSVQGVTSPDRPEQVGILSLGWRLPLYRQQAALEAYASSSDVDGGTTPTLAGDLRFAGKGRVVGVRWSQLLPRWGEADQRLSIALDQRDYLNHCAIDGLPDGACGAASQSVSSRPLAVEYSLRSAADTPWLLQLGLHHNLGGGRHGQAEAFEAVRPGAPRRYTVLRAQGQLRWPLADDWSLQGRVALQWTRDPLVPGEQFGLGGAQLVRGYEEREATGDRGWLASLEVASPPWPLQGTTRLGLSAFADIGRVQLLQGPGCGTGPMACSLASAGLSARLADAGTQLLLSAAMALREGPRTARDQWRLHASLSHPF